MNKVVVENEGHLIKLGDQGRLCPAGDISAETGGMKTSQRGKWCVSGRNNRFKGPVVAKCSELCF